MFGFTENYIKVKMPYNASLTNTIQPVELSEIDDDMIVSAGILQCV